MHWADEFVHDSHNALHSISTEPVKKEACWGLALSGGGFRAMLFHLGVVRYLHDKKLLQNVKYVCCVSGGSILGAHLVLNWDTYLTNEPWDATGSPRQLVDFAEYDVSPPIFRRAVSILRVIPGLWSGWSPTRLLRRYYRRLYQKRKLRELAPTASGLLASRPELHILTTDLEREKLCSFSHGGFCCDILEPVPQWAKIADQEIALAVAASSAFPIAFGPITLTPRRVGKQTKEFFGRDRIVLSDGGVYDNLALLPFETHERQWKCEVVLVSDASRVPDWSDLSGRRPFRNYMAGLKRAYEITSDQLYRGYERMHSAPRFVHIPIHTPREGVQYEDGTLPIEDRERLKDVRTDLDALPGRVIKALVLHGQAAAKETLTQRQVV